MKVRALTLACAVLLSLSGVALLRAEEFPVSRGELDQLRRRVEAQESELRALREQLPGSASLVRLPAAGRVKRDPPRVERLPPPTDESGPLLDAPQSDPAPTDPSVGGGSRWRKTLTAAGEKLQTEDDQQQADADELPGAQITAELQVDNYYFGQDADNKATVGDIADGSAFRRARVGWFGTQEVTEWRFEMDFALQGRPSFLDVFAGVNDLPVLNQLLVGHFTEPFGLERVTSNRYAVFMERSLLDQPFSPARNLGIASWSSSDDEMMTWAYGVFAGNSNPFGDQQSDSDETALTGRVTRLLWYDEPSNGRYWFHLGFGYSLREPNMNTAQFQSQPEARLGATTPNVPFFVNTGPFPSRYFQLFDVEAAWVNGPFSLQAEFYFVPVQRISGPDPFFNGWYLTASYLLTGEHRPYDRQSGTFDRVEPREHFFRVRAGDRVRMGMGAWEIAMRLSHLDLTDKGIEGGRLTDLTVGLNWYMTTYLRFTSNYIHAFLDNPTQGNSGADIFGMRIQYDF